MKITLIVVFMTSLFLYGCEKPQNPEAVKKEVENLSKKFADSFNKEDLEGIMSVYWNDPNLICYFPDNNLTGYEAVKEYWKNTFANVDVKKFEVAENHHQVTRDVVYEWGMYNLVLQPTGGPEVNAPGRYSATWEKKNEQWLMTLDHASVLMTLPPPADTSSVGAMKKQ